MRRREFLGGVGTLTAIRPLASRARQISRVLRVGTAGFLPRSIPQFVAFERRLAELGYREGDNFTFDYVQLTGPTPLDYEVGFRELGKRNPDIILALGSETALKAALVSSNTTPIVFLAADFDPIAHGYVMSLARPGGRITGPYLQIEELARKRFALLKQAIPEITSVIVLFDAITRDQWPAVEKAGPKLGLKLFALDLKFPPFDYEKGFAEARFEKPNAIFALPSSRFTVDATRISEFALRHRLASIFWDRSFVAAGALMSYGPDVDRLFAQAADFVDRIARGANAGDLPIEQPTKFELAVNLRTARALGLDIPPTLLAAADEVIE